MHTPFVVEARALSKSVISNDAPLPILTDLHLAVAPGERVAITGRSGAGKSTLLGLLAGLDTASQGQVLIQGQDLTPLDEDQRAAIRARVMGFVFQSFQLLPALTALENVMLPLQLAARPDAHARALTALQQVGLETRATHTPKQLSGGEQQRVAIARAFAGQPALLFADEPTGNLDSETGQRIIDLLFDLNQQHGTTLVLVTHDNALAHRCQRVLQLQHGALQTVSATPAQAGDRA